MKLTATSLFLTLAVCCAVSNVEGRRRRAGKSRRVDFQEEQSEVKESWDGSFRFPRELKYSMKLEGEGRRELDLVLNPYIRLPDKNAERRKQYAFYTEATTGESFACKVRRRNGRVQCDIAGILERDGETCYISPSSNVADCEGSEGFTDGVLLGVDDDDQVVYRTKFEPLSSSSSSSSDSGTERYRRSIFPAPGFRIIEVFFVGDESFMDFFYARNPNDDVAAEEEAELYVTLLANEMSIYYSSVAEVTSGDYDFVVLPTGLRHPGKGNNFDWSENNKLSSTTLSTDTGLPALNSFRNSDLTGVSYDHVMGLTGLDLSSTNSGTGVLGVAYINTVCRSGSSAVSLQENRGYNLGWIAAHELGHALGSGHDSGSCPTRLNIMSSVLFSPSVSTQNTFYKFSSCSANQFISHINSQPNCTGSDGPTSAQFRDSFCQGLLGATEMSLDRQCQVILGSSTASACTSVASEDACFLPNEVSCRSAPSGTCSTSLRYVWNGTPCGTNPGYLCYKASCVPEFDICPVSSSPPSTTSSPQTPSSSPTSAPTSSPTTTSGSTTSTGSSPTTTTPTITTTMARTTTTSGSPTSTGSSPTTTTPTITTTRSRTCSCCRARGRRRRRRCCRRSLRRGLPCMCCRPRRRG